MAPTDVVRAQKPDEDLLPLIDVLITSSEFPNRLTGISDLRTSLIDMKSRYGCPIVGATLGAQGALVYCEGEFLRSPSFPVPGGCHDTTGAGDAFDAGFIAGQLRGLDTAASAVLAYALEGAPVWDTEFGFFLYAFDPRWGLRAALERMSGQTPPMSMWSALRRSAIRVGESPMESTGRLLYWPRPAHALGSHPEPGETVRQAQEECCQVREDRGGAGLDRVQCGGGYDRPGAGVE